MNIEESLSQLNNILIVEPNRHLDCFIQELEEYKFIKRNVLPISSPLWQQSLYNVSVKIYDLDLFGLLPEIDNIVYQLHHSDVGLELIKHYLLIDVNDYEYVENPQDHFLKSNSEKIKTDTLYTSIANIIINDMEQTINSIKVQLLKLNKKDWLPLLSDEGYEEDIDDDEAEEFFKDLNYFLNS
jgi:hypothetical protein